MDCNLTYLELAAYTCGDTGRSMRGRIRSHLASCDRCRRRLDTLHEVDAVLRKAAPVRPPLDVMRTCIIWAAIECLPGRQRYAIAMHAFGNKSYREIASRLQVPESTVQSLVHRARGNLARAMEPLRQTHGADRSETYRSVDMMARPERP